MSDVFMSEAAKAAPARIVGKLETIGAPASSVIHLLDAIYADSADVETVYRFFDTEQELAKRALSILGVSDEKASASTASIRDIRTWRLVGAALAISVFDTLSSPRFRSLDAALYWRHSLAVAAAARFVAGKTGYGTPDEAWLVGFLHDIGRAALDIAAPDEFAAAIAAIESQRSEAVLVERDSIGMDHAAVGEFVLRRWGVPERIARAVGLHHAETLSGLADKSVAALAAVSQAADFIAWADGLGGLTTAPKLASTLVTERAMKSVDQAAVFEEIAAELARCAPAFGVRPPGDAHMRGALSLATVELGRIRNVQHDLESRLERKIREVEAVNLLRTRVRNVFEKDEVKRAFLAALRQGLGFDRACFLDFDAAAGIIRGASVEEITPSKTDIASISFAAPAAGTLLARCIESGRATILLPDDLPREMSAAIAFPEAVVVPVTAGKHVAGIALTDNAVSARPLTSGDVASVSILAGEAAIALENLMLYEHAQRMKAMAETDALTGLHNRRYLMHLLQNEVDRAKRYNAPLSLVMIDLEGFKAFNDTYGHQAGDTVLKSFGRLLKRTSRNIDIPGRLGGDEFLVILPGTNLEAAGTYIDRVRKVADTLDKRLQERYADCRFTMSVGMTSFNYESDTLDSFLHRADQAMYAAKQRGRNRICAL